MPELARFDWEVPPNAPNRACLLTIVESADDQMPAAVRGNNLINLWQIVPQNRHMTVRNLHFVDPPAKASASASSKLVEVIAVPNPTPDDGLQLVISQDFGKPLRILLPRELDAGELEGIRKMPARLSAEERRMAAREKLDARFVYELAAGNGGMRLPVKSGETWRIGVSAEANPPARLNLITTQGRTVLGGSSYLFRARGSSRLTRTLH
jgi:hypothetical protein